MSALVAELTERYPQVEIELVADTALNLREQLQKGFLDVILQTDLLRRVDPQPGPGTLPHGLDRCRGLDPAA